jgi:hypothetical protein
MFTNVDTILTIPGLCFLSICLWVCAHACARTPHLVICPFVTVVILYRFPWKVEVNCMEQRHKSSHQMRRNYTDSSNCSQQTAEFIKTATGSQHNTRNRMQSSASSPHSEGWRRESRRPQALQSAAGLTQWWRRRLPESSLSISRESDAQGGRGVQRCRSKRQQRQHITARIQQCVRSGKQA